MNQGNAHCKLCMAREKCDAVDCSMAFLAEMRPPQTPAEIDLATRIAAIFGVTLWGQGEQ